MKLELLDAYNIRARLSASIILLSPIAMTAFLCFNSVSTVASSSIFVFVLLAFTNYIPLLQRRFQRKNNYINYASQLLLPSDKTIDIISKNRYYNKLASIDDSFALFETPNNTQEFKNCCDSAVKYLRTHSRENHLVLEENINYGFCKNLHADKLAGIILCLSLMIGLAIYSLVHFDCVTSISLEYYYAFAFNGVLLLFWIFGITENMVTDAALRYAKALISFIDEL